MLQSGTFVNKERHVASCVWLRGSVVQLGRSRSDMYGGSQASVWEGILGYGGRAVSETGRGADDAAVDGAA